MADHEIASLGIEGEAVSGLGTQLGHIERQADSHDDDSFCGWSCGNYGGLHGRGCPVNGRRQPNGIGHMAASSAGKVRKIVQNAPPPSDRRLIAAALEALDGLSLREAADRVGVSYEQIRRMRAGEPRYSLQADTRAALLRYLRRRQLVPEPLPRTLTRAERERLREMAEALIAGMGASRERLIERVEEMRRALEGID